MNNQDIPADKINEAVARAQGWVEDKDYSVIMDRHKVDHIRVFTDEPRKHRPDLRMSVPFCPLTNHNQFHEIWTAEIEAKACDVLDRWLYEMTSFDTWIDWWQQPDYQSNPRLWQLRAYCEVMGNEE